MTALIPARLIWDSSTTLFQCSTIPFYIGYILISLGLFILVQTIKTLATECGGTSSPWGSPTKLVVCGIYSYVRNPMISGVLLILLGEALTFNSRSVMNWCIIFFIINTLYFILIDEPVLTTKFGDDYREYKKNVNRWLPRRTPWRQKNCASFL